jgi:hypothetical protein
MQTEIIGFAASTEFKQALEKYCKTHSITMSSLIRQQVSEKLIEEGYLSKQLQQEEVKQ